MQLSNAEEQLMEHLWKLDKAFMKDLLEAYPEPKPATTTVATLLKRMIDKNLSPTTNSEMLVNTTHWLKIRLFFQTRSWINQKLL